MRVLYFQSQIVTGFTEAFENKGFDCQSVDLNDLEAAYGEIDNLAVGNFDLIVVSDLPLLAEKPGTGQNGIRMGSFILDQLNDFLTRSKTPAIVLIHPGHTVKAGSSASVPVVLEITDHYTFVPQDLDGIWAKIAGALITTPAKTSAPWTMIEAGSREYIPVQGRRIREDVNRDEERDFRNNFSLKREEKKIHLYYGPRKITLSEPRIKIMKALLLAGDNPLALADFNHAIYGNIKDMTVQLSGVISNLESDLARFWGTEGPFIKIENGFYRLNYSKLPSPASGPYIPKSGGRITEKERQQRRRAAHG